MRFMVEILKVLGRPGSSPWGQNKPLGLGSRREVEGPGRWAAGPGHVPSPVCSGPAHRCSARPGWGYSPALIPFQGAALEPGSWPGWGACGASRRWAQEHQSQHQEDRPSPVAALGEGTQGMAEEVEQDS